ncbi:hypothetical protein FRB94_004469 [Tulasnella sp. JGI-2019a]|nr:hypothetical protein FRB94_004469 [Tulasnella sp. JGI-2019a]
MISSGDFLLCLLFLGVMYNISSESQFLADVFNNILAILGLVPFLIGYLYCVKLAATFAAATTEPLPYPPQCNLEKVSPQPLPPYAQHTAGSNPDYNRSLAFTSTPSYVAYPIKPRPDSFKFSDSSPVMPRVKYTPDFTIGPTPYYPPPPSAPLTFTSNYYTPSLRPAVCPDDQLVRPKDLPQLPSVNDLLEATLTHLRSTRTFLLPVDATGTHLPRKLSLSSDYWHVTDKATGLSVGIVDRASHFGLAILSIAKIDAETIDQMPTDPVLMVLREHFFNPLLRNRFSRYPILNLSSKSIYIEHRDQDNSHSSFIKRDGRLHKALELIASGDFTTSVDSLTVGSSPVTIPVTAVPVSSGLPSVEANIGAISPPTTHTAAPIVPEPTTDDFSTPVPAHAMGAEPVSTPITATFNRSTVPSVFSPPIAPFPHHPLHEHDIQRLIHPSPIVKGEIIVDGACAVTSGGADGVADHGPLHVSIQRFLNRDTSEILNDPVLTFTRDGVSVGSFAVVEAFQPERNIDDFPCFRFVVQRVGQEERGTVSITMSEEDGQKLCGHTGRTLPNPSPVQIAEPEPESISTPTVVASTSLLQAQTSPPAALAVSSPASPTLSPPGRPVSPVTAVPSNRPTIDKVYRAPCFFDPKSKPTAADLEYRFTNGIMGPEWQYSDSRTNGAEKEGWITLTAATCEWRQDGGYRLIKLVGFNVASEPRELTIRMSGAFGTTFCEWIGIRQIPTSRETTDATASVASISAHVVPTSNVPPPASIPTFDFGAHPALHASSAPSTPVFVFGAPSVEVASRAIKPLKKSTLSRAFNMRF